MLRNRRKTPFRSYTDINNYNNFLLELDKQNKIKQFKYNSNKSNSNKSNSNKSITTPIPIKDEKPYKREHIKIFLKEDNNTFSSLNGYSSGIAAFDALLASIEKHLESNNTQEDVNKQEIKKPIVYKQKVTIVKEINNISDLLELIDLYPDDKETEYNIDMSALHNIKEPLTALNNMIGMKKLKENIVDQIIFYIQNLHTLNSKSSNDFMHTVIYGPPGTGKTEIAKIIGSIFSKIGILKKGTFKKVTRADLVAGYLGQTAIKTRDIIKESLGGVLFIDEAYSLGNSNEDKKDIFSKECIDTLCEALSDHKDNLMVIIAGYENNLNNCFFNTNPGLASRFTWRFKIDNYTAEDLYKIFIKKVTDGGWSLSLEDINVKWFEKNKVHFKYYGRDIETLFAKTKIAHSRRVFCLDASEKKQITIKDMNKGLEIYISNKEKQDDEINNVISSMYI